MHRISVRLPFFLLTFLVFTPTTLSAVQICPAGTAGKIWANPSACEPNVNGDDCEPQGITGAKTTIYWCDEGAGKAAVKIPGEGRLWCGDVTGEVQLHFVQIPTIPPTPSGRPQGDQPEGLSFQLWSVDDCDDPQTEEFLDEVRVHHSVELEPALGRLIMSLRANPPALCDIDGPDGLQFCRDPQVPDESPWVEMALTAVDPDLYDLEVELVAETETTIQLAIFDDPNANFENPLRIDLDDVGRCDPAAPLTCDPDTNDLELPWSIHFKLWPEGDVGVGNPLFHKTTWIRALPKGVMEIGDPTCLTANCTIDVDQIHVRNLAWQLYEFLEIRDDQDHLLWQSVFSGDAVPEFKTEAPISLSNIPATPGSPSPYKLRLIARSGFWNASADHPSIYEQVLDEVLIHTGGTQGRLHAKNPCTAPGTTSACENPRLSIEGFVDQEALMLYKISGSGTPLEMACWNAQGLVDDYRDLSVGNSPTQWVDKTFELHSVASCQSSYDVNHRLDELVFTAHPVYDVSSTPEPQSLVCEETNQSVDVQAGGSLGVIVNELQLPGTACLPTDIRYQRAAEVAAKLPQGLRYIRRTIRWDSVQPSSGSFDFSRYDCLLDIFDDRFEFFLTLGRTPDWACEVLGSPNDQGQCVPREDAWKAFVEEVTWRYGHEESPHTVDAVEFEIWQEPSDEDFFDGEPEDYQRILKVAYEADRPEETRIWAPNLVFGRPKGARNIENFLEVVLDPQNVYLDGVAIHDFQSLENTGKIAETVRYTRELMDSVVDPMTGTRPYESIPIAVTAFSVASEPNTLHACIPKDEPDKTIEYLREHLECGLAAGAETMIWFSATDHRFWQCGYDPETDTSHLSGNGLLQRVRNVDPIPADITKPDFAEPVEVVGCLVDPSTCPPPPSN